MKKIICLLLVWLLVVSLPAGASGKEGHLVFAPHWLPQAQFAGYYVAQDQGFYEEAGITVDIIHPTASVNAMQYLLDGKADIISMFLTSALDAVQKEANIVNIGQLSQHSAIMFVSMKDSGVESIYDMEGKKVGIWKSGFREVPVATLDKYEVEVEWVPILSTVNLFLLGGIDVMTVMWYNEYNQIYLSGIDRDEMNTFFLSDYGFDVPEDGLYVFEETRKNRESDLRAFVEASLRGWEYAAQNREYATRLTVQIMRGANIPSNHAHQRWMLNKVLEMQCISIKEVKPSELHPGDFEKAVSVIERFYDREFTPGYREFFQPVVPAVKKSNIP